MFDCVISMESVPMNTVYMLSISCVVLLQDASSVNIVYSEETNISSSRMTKRKIEEVERKFSQIDEDKEFCMKNAGRTER